DTGRLALSSVGRESSRGIEPRCGSRPPCVLAPHPVSPLPRVAPRQGPAVPNFAGLALRSCPDLRGNSGPAATGTELGGLQLGPGGGAGDHVVAGGEILGAQRGHQIVFVGYAAEVVLVPRQEHVQDRAENENADRGNQDWQPHGGIILPFISAANGAGRGDTGRLALSSVGRESSRGIEPRCGSRPPCVLAPHPVSPLPRVAPRQGPAVPNF